MRRKILFSILVLAAFLLLAAVVYSWTPPGDIDLRSYYDLINAVYINGTNITAGSYFIGNGSLLTDILTFNSTYDDYVTANVSAETDYVANSTERNLFTATYNATYHDYVEANVSAETDYMANSTERDLFTATYNTTYHDYVEANVSAVTANVVCTNCVDDTDVEDDITITSSENITSTAGFLARDNVKFWFGTGKDIAMYYNGTHFVIESA